MKGPRACVACLVPAWRELVEGLSRSDCCSLVEGGERRVVEAWREQFCQKCDTCLVTKAGWIDLQVL